MRMGWLCTQKWDFRSPLFWVWDAESNSQVGSPELPTAHDSTHMQVHLIPSPQNSPQTVLKLTGMSSGLVSPLFGLPPLS